MQIKGFIWDDWAIGHIDKHGVTPQEVEEACYYQPLTLKTRYGRYLMLGQSQGGRYLAIVIEHKGSGIVRTITARDMSGAERRRYIKER